MPAALVIFSRVPLPSRTKSRLQSRLSPAEAALFHRACLTDLYRLAMSASIKAFLYVAGGDKGEFTREFPAPLPPGFEELGGLSLEGLEFRLQGGGDLGERMYRAAAEVLPFYRPVLLVGSDLPVLTLELLRAALAALSGREVVIGPALDGGYYLLGLKEAYPDLFQGIAWGTGRVREQTLRASRRKGLRVALLPVLRDIDGWNDLVAYREWGRNRPEATGLISFRLADYLVAKYS
ncbi:2-phospho-L-lactate guanylyltransferase [Moorella thermoacetica]|uniref:2-phospho-L-lactate guanylyltransferase n=1 Tax=Neomoorella thermoacetica TaxID=1525 RepID=A0A1J5NRT1_NEOTH|nr:2-phospho-L-lactate guanylyltransferase [Moorella thermoacetica]